MRKKDAPAIERFVRWPFGLKILLGDSLPPAAPANEVWWRGNSGRYLESWRLGLGVFGCWSRAFPRGVFGFGVLVFVAWLFRLGLVSPGPGGRTWTNVSHEGLVGLGVDKRGRTFCDHKEKLM